MAYLRELRRYFRQVAGQLVLGSIAGIVMNTAVVLPAILLGRAIDRALALERGEATPGDVGWAALAFIAGTLLTEVPRIVKRWWLMTANARIRANLRADAFRGVLGWPMADQERTPIGDLMARIVGDVEVLGVGVREFTIETWDSSGVPGSASSSRSRSWSRCSSSIPSSPCWPCRPCRSRWSWLTPPAGG